MTALRPIQALCAAIAMVLSASSCFAAQAEDAASRLAPAIGNVIVSTHPDGRKARLRLQPGGSYTAEGRAGERSSGAWKIKGEKLCLNQHRPFPIPFSYCKLIPAEALGRPWTDTAVNGDKVTNEIIRGR